VADALLPAIVDILGEDVATAVVTGAWEAYWALADIMIEAEGLLMAETA
jgi:nitric oxide dioxygenase/hemoglobin